jgi:hypothetical protein
MADSISPDELIDRLADVSHATWVLQAVRDNLRPYETPAETDYLHTKGSPEHAGDVEAAEALLERVMGGEGLAQLTDNEAHLPTNHDRERARLTVRELERLGIFPAPGDV